MTTVIRDRFIVIFSILLAWQITTDWFHLLDPQLFPPPLKVFALFIDDKEVFWDNLASSLQLLFWGYLMALITAIPLGLLVGWHRRFQQAIEPVTNFLSPVPPIVYIPYAIALLPTFKLSSIFVIFIGAFWPLFVNTVSGVQNVEVGLINSARTLGVNHWTLLTRILLPGAMPHILTGGTVSLVLAFILLTAAEMIGATSGLGWYVKYFSDFADYARVIAGIILIGLVVLILMTGYQYLTNYLLRWRKT